MKTGGQGAYSVCKLWGLGVLLARVIYGGIAWLAVVEREISITRGTVSVAGGSNWGDLLNMIILPKADDLTKVRPLRPRHWGRRIMLPRAARINVMASEDQDDHRRQPRHTPGNVCATTQLLAPFASRAGDALYGIAFVSK